MKRIICLILALCLIFLCSCNKQGDVSNSSGNDTNHNSVDSNQLSLFYCVDDSINPYLAKTSVNRQLSLLIFDPLVRLTPAFEPQFVLANNITQNGNEYIITLKNTTFSDGSPVTAEDVVYSYKLAKNSDTVYAASLINISSFKAQSSDTIKVTTQKIDPYFANTLDFPVLKSKSDKLTDENKIALPPIGSGRYTPDFDNLKLNVNETNVMGASIISVINLINTPDNQVTKYNLETGNVSIYFSDLSDGTIPPMTGNINTVSINHLVYLGINLNKKTLRDENFRYALSMAVNRNDVCNNAYHSYANPASGIFNPVWDDAKGIQNLPVTSNIQIMVAYLEKLGYNSKDEDGYYVNSNNKRLSFSLVYYNGNVRRAKASQLIAEQLRSAGIEINEKALDWDGYVSALEKGRFDLYVAEVKISNNMDITELVTPGGNLAYGLPKSKAETDTESEQNHEQEQNESNMVYNVANSVKGFYKGQYSLVDIINAFNAEMPLVPICYPLGITISNPSLNAVNVSSVSDAYFGISNIK